MLATKGGSGQGRDWPTRTARARPVPTDRRDPPTDPDPHRQSGAGSDGGPPRGQGQPSRAGERAGPAPARLGLGH